jgi:hypothetical protein
VEARWARGWGWGGGARRRDSEGARKARGARHAEGIEADRERDAGPKKEQSRGKVKAGMWWWRAVVRAQGGFRVALWHRQLDDSWRSLQLAGWAQGREARGDSEVD